MANVVINLQKAAYVPGEELSGTVYVSLEKQVSQRSATIILTGKEITEVNYTTMVQSGKTSTTHTKTAVEESVFLHQESPMAIPTDLKGKIGPGNFNFPFRFMLPQGLLATYKGRHARIRYSVSAKIDVPLWVDVTGSSEFEVVTYGSRDVQPPPTSACSDSWGNLQSGGISFTLERCEYGRGEVLSGKCDFRNPGSKDLRKIDVALRWIETVTAQGHGATTEVMEQVAEVPIQGRVAQGTSPFNIRIPQDAPPTYESTLSSVRCILSTNLDIAWAGDVTAKQTIKIVGKAGDARIPPAYYAERPTGVPATVPQQPYGPGYVERPTANLFCAHCGAAITRPGATYCPNCGERISR
nr:zinc-ribbon domain-containing protein [Candidatus Njordarchaeota archaeon]